MSQLLVINKDEVVITLPKDERLSTSEKNVVLAGFKRAVQVVVGKETYTVMCSVYKRNPDYKPVPVAKTA